MCCGKVRQGIGGKKDKCACGAYSLNFAIMAMLGGNCASQDEILSEMYSKIKFDNTNPFGKNKDEEYSDPRKMCKWVNENMKTIKAKLYVNAAVLTEAHPILQKFWSDAGFKSGDYTTGEGLGLLGTQVSTNPTVTAVCAFAWFTASDAGMHFVAMKDKGGTAYACDPYHGRWHKTKKPTYKVSIETSPTSTLMYIGVAVVLSF